MKELKTPQDVINFVVDNYATFPDTKLKKIFDKFIASFWKDMRDGEYLDTLDDDTVELVKDFNAQFEAINIESEDEVSEDDEEVIDVPELGEEDLPLGDIELNEDEL